MSTFDVMLELDSDELAVLKGAELLRAGKRVSVVGKLDKATGQVVLVEAVEHLDLRAAPCACQFPAGGVGGAACPGVAQSRFSIFDPRTGPAPYSWHYVCDDHADFLEARGWVGRERL